MSIFSILWKPLKICIFTDEFDEIYGQGRDTSTFVLYCFAGGFFFHRLVRPGFRKFLIYFNVINFILIYACCLFFLFNTPIENYLTYLLPVQEMLALPGNITLYYWIYSNRDQFSKLIETIDDNERKYQKYVPLYTTRLNKSHIIIVKILCCVIAFFCVIFNLENYLKHENYLINYYPVYFPFRTTFLLRLVIRFIQMVTVIPQNVSFLSLPMLIFAITLNVYNRFELLSVSLRDTSYSVNLIIDEITNLELAMDEKRIPKSMARIHELNIKKALAIDELARKTIIVIKRHRELYFIAKSLAKKLEYMAYVAFQVIFIIAVIYWFLISLIMEARDLNSLLTLNVLTCGIFLVWFVFCFVGELFERMNEIIATEIYESPWYHLKPKDRRLVHTFLTIIRRPISIVVWKIHPVNLRAFPSMLNTVYSNMQRLRTIQSYKA